MPYTIGYIVYGLDLVSCSYGQSADAYKALKDIGTDILSQHIENETVGFDRRYSGGGDEPQWFGVEIGQFDECDTVDGEWLAGQLLLTDELKKKYEDLIEEFSKEETNEEFLSTLKSFTPKIMIQWGTS